MVKKLVLGVLLLLVLVVAACGTQTGMENDAMEDDSVADDAMDKDMPQEDDADSAMEEDEEETMENEEAPAQDDAMEKDEDSTALSVGTTIKMTDEGFDPKEVTVKVGEKVVFMNERDGRYKDAIVVGTRACSDVRSQKFGPGETFEYTFKTAQTCNIVDGVLTTQTVKVTVEE